jgi:hypothetical protein
LISVLISASSLPLILSLIFFSTIENTKNNNNKIFNIPY